MNIIKLAIDKNSTHKEQSAYCIENLRKVCKELYGFSFDVSDIAKKEHGKPYFKYNDELHFNISHSNEMAVIVLDEKPCGVDVELLREIKYNVAGRFFAPDEKEWVSEASGDEKILRFFKVWTGKEAYTKMLGCGLTVPLNSFSVLEEGLREKLEYIEENGYLICICRF